MEPHISHITGTHIAYFQLCHRKLWLFAKGIQMEQRSELVAEGKFIEERSYRQRAERWKEIQIEGCKIDYFDPKRGIVREVKKSAKHESAHIAQVKYYLYVLERNGIKVSHGLLEYPRLRETEEVWLQLGDREEIAAWEIRIRALLAQKICPSLEKKTLCKRCAYREFCFVS